MVFLQTKWQVVAAVLDWCLFGFSWVLTGGAECVFWGCWGWPPFWQADVSSQNHHCVHIDMMRHSLIHLQTTLILLPGVIVLPQLNLNIFLILFS